MWPVYELLEFPTCLFLLMKVTVLFTELHLTLPPQGLHSSPDSSVHGILQARILEGVAIPFSGRGGGLLDPGDMGVLNCRQILYQLSHQR